MVLYLSFGVPYQAEMRNILDYLIGIPPSQPENKQSICLRYCLLTFEYRYLRGLSKQPRWNSSQKSIRIGRSVFKNNNHSIDLGRFLKFSSTCLTNLLNRHLISSVILDPRSLPRLMESSFSSKVFTPSQQIRSLQSFSGSHALESYSVSCLPPFIEGRIRKKYQNSNPQKII